MFIFIVLGGVHILRNQIWEHELRSHSWECATSRLGHYCKVNEPSAIISIFNHADMINTLFSFIFLGFYIIYFFQVPLKIL